MIKLLEAGKNRIIAVTFVFLFCTFALFSLIDLERAVSDHYFYAGKINDIFRNINDGEIAWLNLRTTNYINSIVEDYHVVDYVLKNDRAGLKRVFDPVIDSFNTRQVPVFAIVIADSNGKVIFKDYSPQAGTDLNHINSKTLKAAIASGKPEHGFESGPPFIHHAVALPLIDKTNNKIIGAIKIYTSLAYFHLAHKWHFDDIKTIIVQKNLEGETVSSPFSLPDDSLFANKEKRKQDIEFFQSILNKIDFNSEFTNIKVNDRHYLVSTSARLLSVNEDEVGRILAAYETTDFRNRQWTYLLLWIAFFALTAGLMFLVNYIGFRKYERIVTEQSKKLAHRSKQCALGEMLSYIGHQWRQPLNALSLTIQNIELQNSLGKLDAAVLEKQVQIANRNIGYLTQTIEDWRSLLTSGTTRQTIELAESVNRALAIVSPVLEQCRIQVENRIAGTFKTCGFVNDLVQLTINVLLNAKDALAGREGDRLICLSCRVDGDTVTMEFQDNGGGIPQKLLPTVFEAYQTTKEDSGGTGLGLYLCRQIAENLDGGSVRAENRAFEFAGQRHFGACITLEFKICKEENCLER